LDNKSSKFKYSKIWFSRSWNTSLGLAFGGGDPAFNAATEEWTGAGSALTKTITVS
jgi:hypothetical protein